MVTSLGVKLEIKYQEQYRRIYHKTNLISLVFNVQDLGFILEQLNQDGEDHRFSHLIIRVKQTSSPFVNQDIMNLSPCKDKKTPIRWRPKPEPQSYLRVETVDEKVVQSLEWTLLKGN